MKKYHAWVLYTFLGCAAGWTAEVSPSLKSSRRVAEQNGQTGWQAIKRSENQTRWQTVTWQTNATTLEVSSRVASFVELGAGLNVKTPGGEFVAADPSFVITATGAEASRTAHHVSVPADIGTGEGVTITTPTGETLVFQPFAVNYFDPVDGNNVVLDSITNAVGWLMASNEIVFSNCFTHLKASIRLRNTRSGIESDLILHEQPPEPSALGLSAKTRLEMLTEQIRGDNPMKRENVLRHENNSALRAAMVEPDFKDTGLSFGGMTMMRGKAFGIPKEQTSGVDSLPSRVGKSFLTIENRRILIEAVEHESVRPALRRLPAATGSQPRRAQRIQPPPVIREAAATRPLPHYPVNGKSAVLGPTPASRSIQQARHYKSSEDQKLLAQAEPGFVLDYQLVNAASLTDYTFQNDTTYYVAEYVSMIGTTILEGGTVLKYSDYGCLVFNGATEILQCKTDIYRPAVFTCYDDNTVGETLPDSTGNPSQAVTAAFYFLDGNRELENVRFTHLYLPIVLETGGGSLTVRNVQVTDAAYFIDAGTAPLSVFNGLFHNCGAIFYGGYATFYGEHLTVHNADVLGAYTTNCVIKNSLLVSIANPPTDVGTYTEVATTNLSSASGVFQTVGAGAYYLADPSPYRDAGTTNIDSSLRNALRKRTTYPPLIIAPGGYYGVSQTLSPRCGWDTDLPDLGYHYDPLDYAISFIYLTNAAIQVDLGTAIAVFNPSNASTAGIFLAEGSQFLPGGRGDSKVTITHYATVQEMANTNWNGPITALVYPVSGSGSPAFRCRFTDFTVLAGNTPLIFSNAIPWQMTDCQFHGGALYNYNNGGSMFMTNCLFNRNIAELWLSETISNQFRNCTYYGGGLLLSSPVGMMTDCLFVGTTRLYDYDVLSDIINSNIAYTTNSPWRIAVTNVNDVILTSLTFQTSPLGYFYISSNALWNAGSRNATNAGLYHYTMLTNQVKETNTTVDIGFHYVATDANGTPRDYDGDGVPDYWEDTNGNGSYGAGLGETDWQTYNSANGLGSSPSLLIFTPLK